ncbi:hypothetical protein PXO_05725 [Xanthomonas oryzae pv. oryzae PXO99A]|uniref:Uncharacterized protein n=1 Tax=Xanthomonas oryzae pv. oryzae (strain PXO99A) TaxID=360094 RepID=A0A0K0GNY7_XANOP|nr:hypothetical protein PXO_05725 [Xanthomonas oryzae pv. oryzae PXO99A]
MLAGRLRDAQAAHARMCVKRDMRTPTIAARRVAQWHEARDGLINAAGK